MIVYFESFTKKSERVQMDWYKVLAGIVEKSPQELKVALL